jgi:hypothetical protein
VKIQPSKRAPSIDMATVCMVSWGGLRAVTAQGIMPVHGRLGKCTVLAWWKEDIGRV